MPKTKLTEYAGFRIGDRVRISCKAMKIRYDVGTIVGFVESRWTHIIFPNVLRDSTKNPIHFHKEFLSKID